MTPTLPSTIARRQPAPAVSSRVPVAICAAGEIFGGVEQFVLTLAGRLRQSRFSPIVAVFHDGLLAARLRERGVPVRVIAGAGPHDPRLASALRAILVGSGARLLHVNGYKATIVAAFARRRLRIPILKTEHGLLEPLDRWRDAGRYARLAANTLVDRLVSRLAVDARVFVSCEVARRMTGGDSPHRVIYNGVEAADSVAARAAEPREPFHVAIVGRVSRVKGHQYLLRAVARLGARDHLRVHVFGSGPLEAYCRAFCRRHGLENVVAFHGFSASLPRELCGMDLVVMPSLHEGLPYALLEALAAGVPVVASAVGGLKEAIERHGCGVLVPSADDAALAEAIDGLRRDPLGRARVASRGRLAVSDRFSAAVMAERYMAEYDRLLGSRA